MTMFGLNVCFSKSRLLPLKARAYTDWTTPNILRHGRVCVTDH